MEGTTITVIPKRAAASAENGAGAPRKRRVCAYARVSTDMEDQKNSFNAQLEYYAQYIRKKPEWEFVRLYSDEGISGTSIKNRKGFQEMLADALGGKIDLILTKSISRFARNTVDCLQKVRELRAKGVTVYFEKENMSTDDPKIEMMLTIFASMAQEESKSISENVKWGVRKRMAAGTTKVSARGLIGYVVDDKGNLEIEPEGAKTVRTVFELYIAGYTYREIVAALEEAGVAPPSGPSWSIEHIRRMLDSEKYCGEVILQKTVVVDFLTHKTVKNNGVEPQYHIKKHHPAIIDPEDFAYVQELRKYNAAKGVPAGQARSMPLSGLVQCGCCLRTMRRINQHSGTAWARHTLTCKNDGRGSASYVGCERKGAVDYDTLLSAAQSAFSQLTETPKELAEILRKAIPDGPGGPGVREFCAESARLKGEIAELESRIRDIVTTQVKSDRQDAYRDEFEKAKEEVRAKREQLAELRRETFDGKGPKAEAAERRLKGASASSPELLRALFSRILILEDGSAVFVMGGPKELTAELAERIKKAPPLLSGVEKRGKFEIAWRAVRLEGKSDD